MCQASSRSGGCSVEVIRLVMTAGRQRCVRRPVCLPTSHAGWLTIVGGVRLSRSLSKVRSRSPRSARRCHHLGGRRMPVRMARAQEAFPRHFCYAKTALLAWRCVPALACRSAVAETPMTRSVCTWLTVTTGPHLRPHHQIRLVPPRHHRQPHPQVRPHHRQRTAFLSQTWTTSPAAWVEQCHRTRRSSAVHSATPRRAASTACG